jgi:hypothetical protein
MHDGSGFYRDRYIDKSHNPYKWGQTCIIDQSNLDGVRYGNLEEIAKNSVKYLNSHLINQKHKYHLKNTRTAEGDAEMAKSLTFWAINHGKPAFANEATKNFGTKYRVYYHLVALEAYLKYMNIKFSRNFDLTPNGVNNIINHTEQDVVLYDKMKLPAKNIKKVLRFFPMKKNAEVEFSSKNPLVAVIKNRQKLYRVCYGNRRITRLEPQFFEYDNSLKDVDFEVDGFVQKVKIGSIVNVSNKFRVKNRDGYRVNVIGYVSKNRKNESEVDIKKSLVSPRYSIDKKGKVYRVEFYKKDKFSGMIMVKFDNSKKSSAINIANIQQKNIKKVL